MSIQDEGNDSVSFNSMGGIIFLTRNAIAVTVPLRIFRADAPPLRCGTLLGQYRLRSRLGEGGFATVYSAYDTVNKCRVAIKIPDSRYITNTQSLSDLRREVRIMGSLKHPAVLPLIDSQIIDGHFIMVFPMGQETLADRMMKRMSRATAMTLITQMVDAIAFSHENEILHRDVKPENFIMFEDNELRLTDFGLARVESDGHEDSASGTLGYIAPEQAMGKPSYRSDVFSVGLIMYRILAGELPEYPFQAPLPGYNKLRRGISRDLVTLIRRSIDLTPAKRFRDGVAMRNAMRKIRQPLSEKSSQEKYDIGVSRLASKAA